jgi:hypothetical protein
MIAENKTRRQLQVGSGFGIVFALVSGLVQRVQHDRRPATGVVVMPVSMMVATCAEHCPGLIPDERHACQTLTPTSDSVRTSREGGNAPAIATAGARFACPFPHLFWVRESWNEPHRNP